MEYYQRNEAALQQEKELLAQEAAEFGQNAPILYLRPGTTMVQILPPFDASGVFFSSVEKHRVKVRGRTVTVACPAYHDAYCAICAKGQELTDSRDVAKMDFAREHLKPKRQYLYNAICFSGPPNNKNETPQFGKVYVLEAGKMVHNQIIKLDQDTAIGWANITDPQNGVMLIIQREGQGLNTKYHVQPHGAGRQNLDQILRSRGIDPATLKLHNLNNVYTLPSDEKMAEIVSGLDGAATPLSQPTFQPVFQPAPNPGFAVPSGGANNVAVPTAWPSPAPQPVQTQTFAPFTPVQPTLTPAPVTPTAPVTPVQPPQYATAPVTPATYVGNPAFPQPPVAGTPLQAPPIPPSPNQR